MSQKCSEHQVFLNVLIHSSLCIRCWTLFAVARKLRVFGSSTHQPGTWDERASSHLRVQNRQTTSTPQAGNRRCENRRLRLPRLFRISLSLLPRRKRIPKTQIKSSNASSHRPRQYLSRNWRSGRDQSYSWSVLLFTFSVDGYRVQETVLSRYFCSSDWDDAGRYVAYTLYEVGY